MFDESPTDKKPGPWSVCAGKGYNSRPFWNIRRHYPGRPFGVQYVMTRRDAKRWYDEAKADAACAKLNAADGVKGSAYDPAGIPASLAVAMPGLVDCGECRTQGCPAGRCRNAGVQAPRYADFKCLRCGWLGEADPAAPKCPNCAPDRPRPGGVNPSRGGEQC